MLRRAVCALCTIFCVLLATFSPALVEKLPAPPEGLTSRPYEGWSGVVRLQVYQGFKSGTGSIVPWLNECLSAFEKRNSGVYIHVETVSSAALLRYQDSPRPDMLIFTPGALKDVQGLIAQESEGLIDALCEACMVGETQYATPLCYGGYGLLINSDLMAELPGDWQQALESVYSAPTRRKSGTYALQVPGEARWAEVTAEMLGGLPPAGELLPDDYLECTVAQAWADFKQGMVACIPASQWQLRQIALLDAEGTAPPWKFYPSQIGYTDQYFAAAIVDTGLEDAQARVDVCREVVAYLTSEDAQSRLDMALMLPAREDMRLYVSGGDMTALETAYLGSAEFESLFD